MKALERSIRTTVRMGDELGGETLKKINLFGREETEWDLFTSWHGKTKSVHKSLQGAVDSAQHHSFL